MNECRTVGVSIKCPPDEVYSFLSDPRNFPKWSAFITEIREHGSIWIAQTPTGTVHISFTTKNQFRVLDHDVTIPSGQIIHVPMRVLPNDRHGSEVIFSIFRQEYMSELQYAEDIGMVLSDLLSLKRIFEDNNGPL